MNFQKLFVLTYFLCKLKIDVTKVVRREIKKIRNKTFSTVNNKILCYLFL